MAVRRCDGVSEIWHDIMDLADLPDGGKVAVRVAGWHLLLLRTQSAVLALNDRCSHAGSPLGQGRLRRGEIICPLHGARFDVASGRCLGGDNPDLRHFAVDVADGRIRVALPDRRPDMEELPLPI